MNKKSYTFRFILKTKLRIWVPFQFISVFETADLLNNNYILYSWQGITRISFKVKSDIFSAALKRIISEEEIFLFSKNYFQICCSDDEAANFHCQN